MLKKLNVLIMEWNLLKLILISDIEISMLTIIKNY
jgi:hypothetical protein